jgi:hypothetical protein
MGTKQMLEWSAAFAERHADQGDSVLILDRLGCHRNRQVLKTLEDGHLHRFLLPPQAAKLVSPCDNSFFASLKARLREMDTSTPEAKEAAFKQVCVEYDPEMVRHYFSHCDWNF